MLEEHEAGADMLLVGQISTGMKIQPGTEPRGCGKVGETPENQVICLQCQDEVVRVCPGSPRSPRRAIATRLSSGSAGDAIRGTYAGIDQNGFGFSTIDRDNDGCSPCIFGDIIENDCSFSEGGGGWWFSRCGSAGLNGDWHPAGEHLGWASGLHWLTWKGPAPYSARATRMMIKSV
uniref:angiopoietin-related protein 5-like n=1 Tax=Centroberyx gerrardi TaxID=166262 RepID=UPI003AACB08B